MDEPAEGLLQDDDDLDLPRVVERKSCASPQNLLLISHFFSAWGDRMWMFAVGLYLVELTPNSLRLTAVYGLVVSFTLVLFGSTVGRFVDVNGRLKVVRISLIVQNVLVCMSALVILAILFRKPGHPYLLIACEATIIILGSLANLASQASTIAVERDWVVVVSGEDKNLLADINAKMRRIDLLCAILAPIAVGLIMTVGSNIAGIFFICGWNVLSFFAEYCILARVYRLVPRLAVKGSATEQQKDTTRGSVESIHNKDEFSKILEDEVHLIEKKTEATCCQKFSNRIRTFWDGWRVYFRQNVAMAGTSLALLYLTVLGFSSVTTGYVYTQQISGAVLSVCYGVGSVMGIVGTFLYPRIRKRCGLVKTGVISFFFQWSMLALCVVSIWTPGSPSDLYPKHNHLWEKNAVSTKPPPGSPNSTKNLALLYTKSPLGKGGLSNAELLNATPGIPQGNKTDNNPKRKQEKFSHISVSLLLTGLILSRAGLWMTDLTVTQLLQENVCERERGIVSGTQSSFNAVLDMLHYVLTIILPRPNQFGSLSLVSFAAVTLGYFIYVFFYCTKANDLCLRERDIISVSSLEWNSSKKSNNKDGDNRSLADLDDEEEIVRGSLAVRESSIENDDVF